MKKVLFPVIGIIALIFIVLSVPRDMASSKFTVKTVTDGNTLVLENGSEIVLLGVQGNDESQKFLKGFEGKDIRIIMDSSSPRLAKVKRGEKRRIYAYVKSKRLCLNSEILRQQLTDILVTPNLTDSLDRYLAYVGKEGEYVFPEPQPEPTPMPEDNDEDDGDDDNKGGQTKPHKGSKNLGWSTNCVDNCSMLSEVVDFRNPVTRNFAVKLASKSPGSYNFGQVCALFDHLYNNWKYVNDPSGAEYVAKSSESIGESNLSGDCDDFAVCMASCIIAIGGEARINTAWGPQGGHAFTEVCVNGIAESELKKTIAKLFPHYSISRVYTRTEGGNAWLNLDWQAAYPGGPYFEYSSITTYQRVSGENWNCR